MKVVCKTVGSRVELMFDNKMCYIKGTLEGNRLMINYSDLMQNESLSSVESDAAKRAIDAFNSSESKVKICVVDL